MAAPLPTARGFLLPSREGASATMLTVAFAVATGLGSLFTLQSYLSAVSEGEAFALWPSLAVQVTPWWLWALIVPVVFEGLARWCPLGASLRRVVVIHLGLAVTLSAVHAVASLLILKGLGIMWLGIPWGEAVRRILVLRFLSNLVIFSLVAALFHVRRHIRELEVSRARIRWLEARRAEGMRRLAGAVSHELSNRLTVVGGVWEFLKEDLERRGDTAGDEIEELDRAVSGVREVVGQISAIGMGGVPIRPELEPAERVVAILSKRLTPSTPRDQQIGRDLESMAVLVDLDGFSDVTEAVGDFLGGTAVRGELGMRVEVVDRPLAGSEGGRGAPEHPFLDLIVELDSGRSPIRLAVEPDLVAAEGTVRSTLALTAARTIMVRMGGDLTVLDAPRTALRLSLPLAEGVVV